MSLSEVPMFAEHPAYAAAEDDRLDTFWRTR
ncbi:MAG: hypothetical protein QOH28_3584 [Actinomycetota bacterium]|jgi:hypothetical protein|nr:hypothetical protein [Actinomycetota bacterium]